MVGMGLASFVDGFARGYGIKQDMQDRDEARKDREADRAFQAEQRTWAAEDRAFQVSERNRAKADRDAIDQITEDSRARYDAEVEAGKYGDSFENWFKTDTLPRLQDELLSQGDLDSAKKLMEWGESDAAKKGGRLFSQAMFLANAGQHGQALDKVIEAGKVQGYIAGDFDIDEKDEIQGPDGRLIGYRVTLRDSDGNETVQDIALEDIPTVIATFANPVAAWESQQAARANTQKREGELEDYRRKKEIDASLDGNKDRGTAIKALRDRIKADPLQEGSVNFDDLPAAERERMISEEIAFTNGTPAPAAPPSRQQIMDNSTGQPVPMAQPQALDSGALQQAPGLGGAPAAMPAPRQEQRMAPGNAVINGVEDPGLPAPPSSAQLVDRAARDMVEGADPQQIARTLKAAGVDEAQWPAQLRRMGASAGVASP